MQRYYKVSIVLLVVLIVLVGVLGSMYIYGLSRASQEEINLQALTDIENGFDDNNFESALTNADDILVDDPNNVVALIAKATTLAQRGSLTFKEREASESALSYINQALQIEPDNAVALRVLGYIHEINEDYEAAHAAYDKSLQLEPSDEVTISQKAHAYELQGLRDVAQSGYEQALAIDPSLAQAVMGIVRLRGVDSMQEESIAMIYSAMESTENVRELSEMSIVKGRLFNSIGNSSLALSEMRNAVEYDGGYPLAKVALAQIQFQIATDPDSDLTFEERDDLLKGSAKELTTAISINPNQTLAFSSLGAMMLYMGEFDQSKLMFEEALKVVTKDITLSADNKLKLKQEIEVMLASDAFTNN